MSDCIEGFKYKCYQTYMAVFFVYKIKLWLYP